MRRGVGVAIEKPPDGRCFGKAIPRWRYKLQCDERWWDASGFAAYEASLRLEDCIARTIEVPRKPITGFGGDTRPFGAESGRGWSLGDAKFKRFLCLFQLSAVPNSQAPDQCLRTVCERDSWRRRLPPGKVCRLRRLPTLAKGRSSLNHHFERKPLNRYLAIADGQLCADGRRTLCLAHPPGTVDGSTKSRRFDDEWGHGAERRSWRCIFGRAARTPTRPDGIRESHPHHFCKHSPGASPPCSSKDGNDVLPRRSPWPQA